MLMKDITTTPGSLMNPHRMHFATDGHKKNSIVEQALRE